MLSLIFIVLAHWNNSVRVDISHHSDTLSWFQANQSLILLVNAVCFAKKQQAPNLLSLVWPVWDTNPVYHTWSKHANHYTADLSWRLFQKRVVGTKFNICVFIIITLLPSFFVRCPFPHKPLDQTWYKWYMGRVFTVFFLQFGLVLAYGVLRHIQQNFSYIVSSNPAHEEV